METKRISRGKAIRLKCLECSGGSPNEVKLCPAESCPLHPFRFGKDPYREKREISPERREQMKQNLAAARVARFGIENASEIIDDVEDMEDIEDDEDFCD